VVVNAHIDFGYPWWLSYGHVVVFVPALALLLLALARKWSKGAIVLFAVLVLWSGVSLFMSRFLFNINSVPPLPAANFFREGKGRVRFCGL
jgi:hypothetical protein